MDKSYQSIKRKNAVRENITAWCFIIPFLLFFLCFLLYPILKGMKLSLFDATLGGRTFFIGIQNYAAMFQDKGFWQAMFNTLFFVVISTPTIVLVGFIFAMFINSRLKGTIFIRTCFFSPYVLSMSVVTGLWIFIFQPYTGLVTQLTNVLGIGEMYWLNTKWLVWLAILITTVWWTVGFNMILFLAGLQDIPEDIYEAARIDGASEFLTFRRVIVPLSVPVIATVGLFTGLAYWNDWINGLYYINDPGLYSIQNLLIRLMNNIQYLNSGAAAGIVSGGTTGALPSTSVRMAIAVVGVIPVVAAYPFLQKYLIRGTVIGAVKG